MSATFNPFARQMVESTVQTDLNMAATAEPVQTTPVEEKPSPALRTSNPFIHHEYEFRPKPEPERTRKPLLAQELLIWIQRHWKKPVVSLRDVCIFGPNSIRERQTALQQIEILVKHGWLVPMKPHRRDRLVWRLPPPGATVLSSEL
jgi:hypothetical protein